MITKERLKKLIEECATIYSNDYGEIQLIKENDLILYDNGQNNYILYALEPNKKYHNEIFDEDLFETEEEAKWFAEFGCVERTEKLELPTWEEVSRDLQNVPAGNYVIKEFDDVSLEYIKYRNGNYAVIGVYKYDDRLELEATKENYIKACRKCVELFKGEKE